MATTHGTTTRNAIADCVVDRIDAGSGAGKLKIYTSGDSLLATLTFSDPAFGAAADGVATASSITSGTATGTGTAAKFTACDSDNNVVFAGSVTATGAGGDLTLSSTAITTGDTVAVNAATYTAPN